MKVSVLLDLIENGGYCKAFEKLYPNKTMDEIKERYGKICRTFLEQYGDMEGALLVSTPGRTEICGNHTDHNLGLVAAAGVNLDIISVACPNNSTQINISSDDYPTSSVSILSLEPDGKERGTSDALIRGVAYGLDRLGYTVKGFNAVADSLVIKGSGLSSSAAYEVQLGAIISFLFNDGKVPPVELAKTGQLSENIYYGKPCGLLDQTACAFGSFCALDFKDPQNPVVRSLPLSLDELELELWIVDTGGSHANLTADYAAIPGEMHGAAQCFGKSNLREIDINEFIAFIPKVREKCGDRAVLRSMHFYGENQRVQKLIEAVKESDKEAFLSCVNESGLSSYMYNQNAYSPTNVDEQGISLAYALASHSLGQGNAFRLQGGGFAGTLQAFIKSGTVGDFKALCEGVYGKGCCQRIYIRNYGAVSLDSINN